MTIGDAFDILLCLIVIGVAVGAITGRDLFGSIALYMVCGLLLAIAWVRLGAVDVALVEAAIGAGLTGVLLLGAAAKAGREAARPPRLRPIAMVITLAVGIGLGWTATELAVPEPGLRPFVEHHLSASGADNPVTAVLLNFRGWDTMLESMVLLIALIGTWSLAEEGRWPGRPGLRQHVRPKGVLATFGRFLPPIGLVVGAYLVWAGTSAPGGAFQAGTVLAAVWLLAMMAGLSDPPRVASMKLRVVLIAGPLLFLVVGLYGLRHGAFLAFPPNQAGMLILAIELALVLSIAATLALLVAGPPRRSR